MLRPLRTPWAMAAYRVPTLLTGEADIRSGILAEYGRHHTNDELICARPCSVGAIHSSAGTALAGASFETFSSSTRKEIAAIIIIIIALLRPGP